MAYDIKHYAELGLLEKLLKVSSADDPSEADVKQAADEIAAAIQKAKESPHDLRNRLGSPNRKATSEVRRLVKEAW